ncbi:MAG: hypothetical protein HRT69_11620 [Flavobacteriaceae bacterium]|nr:hypothetical protein [Flavobacteriaceae bacterium]
MKIFKYINYKDQEERKTLFNSALIFIGTGQLIALVMWYFFKENHFLAIFFSSIVGFLFGYRGSKKN